MNEIQRKTFAQADRQQVQDDTIAAVEANPDLFMSAYREDPRSFDGRYVAADLFKETFASFSASKEARNRYNSPVHNAAAVLSAELFGRNLRVTPDPGRNLVYFLTGAPGAGKTSMVLKENMMPDNAHMIFEGQLSNFDTSREKIQQVLDAGFQPHIIVVHALSLKALENTLQRFLEEGRGSSIETIANIQGGLPVSLMRLHEHFGNRVTLEVADNRDRSKAQQLVGFGHIEALKSEGSYEHIKQRLQTRIDNLRDAGGLSDDAYRQAAGLAPADRLDLAAERAQRSQRDARERGSPEGSRAPAVLDVIGRPGGNLQPDQAPTAGNDETALAAKEKAMREVLESQMERRGLPESERVELRAQLSAVFQNARITGQDLQLPSPQIFQQAGDASPGTPDASGKDSPLNGPDIDR
jgi:hypothetical protein